MFPSFKPYFIAETAFHHEGDVAFLTELVNNICSLEVDALKFHLLFNIDDYIIKAHPAIDVLHKIAIPEDKWVEILRLVQQHGKEIVLLCNDTKSLQWVNQMQRQISIKAIELHSTGLNDMFLLHEASKFNGDIILGVGGSSFDEIQYAVSFLKENGQQDILLMHGFQNYPTDYSEINFRRMQFLQEGFQLQVGYADHTDPTDPKNEIISVLPQVMGFTVLEKHVTHAFGVKRIDAQAAVSVATMEAIISMGKEVFSTRGASVFKLSESEKNYGNTGPSKKAIVARQDIKIGTVLTMDNIAFKRTEAASPLLQKDLSRVIGAIATTDIKTDEIISFSNVQYEFKKLNFDQFFVSENK